MTAAKRRLAFLVAAAAIVVPGPSAHAGHEQVSDVLSFQNVYFPVEPEVCRELERALLEYTADATEAGYPIYVAIIASEGDLGGPARPDQESVPRQTPA